MNDNTIVKCSVESCEHNEAHACNLNTLNISCVCDNKNCQQKRETICNNFSIKRNNY